MVMEHDVATTFSERREGMNASRRPHPKVAAGGAAGSASIVLVYVLGQCGVEVPAEVASALTVLIGFAGGYLKRAA